MSNRFQSLDGLRFFAFLPIFYLHACGGDLFYQLSLTALDLFFVLSGFLTGVGRFKDFCLFDGRLCNLLINGGGKNMSGYLAVYTLQYMRKKIQTFYPWHVFCLLWSICIFSFAPHAAGFMPSSVEEWLWKTPSNLLLIQSWWIAPEVKFSFNGVSWFLASLMFCYAVSPLILTSMAYVLKCWGSISVVLIALSALLIKIIPYVVDANGSFSDDFTVLYDRNVHSLPLLRLLDYLVGMSAGVWYLQHLQNQPNIVPACMQFVVHLLLCVLIIGGSFLFPGPLTLLLCGFWVYLIVKWPESVFSKMLGCRVLVFLGGLVMPVYLTHNLVLKSFRALHIPLGRMIHASIAFLFCFLLAWSLLRLLWKIRNLRKDK